MHIRVLIVLALTCGIATAVPITPSTAAPGQAVASACAGIGIGGSLGPGHSENSGGPGEVCYGMVSAVGGIALATSVESGFMNGFSYSGDAYAQASTGIFKIKTLGSGSAATAFSGSSANAGWNDQFALTGGAPNGTQGIWMAPLHVDGSMSAAGQGALGRLNIAVYKNDQTLTGSFATAYNLFLQASNPIKTGQIQYGYDFQMVAYQVTDYGPASPLTHLNISENRTIWFAIPFTWGTPFEAGFYASAMAGQIASGGTPYANSTAVSFEHTMTWGGKGYVVDGGNSISDFTVASASGFNYNVAVVPEPAAAAPFVLALVAIVWLRKRTEESGRGGRECPRH